MKLFKNSNLNRAIMMMIAVILQGIFAFGILSFFTENSKIIYTVYLSITVFVVLWIVNADGNPNAKISWIIPILILPVFGGIFYLAFGTNQLSLKERRNMANSDYVTRTMLPEQKTLMTVLQRMDMDAYRQSKYIQDYGHYPPFTYTEAEYFNLGEANFQSLKTAFEAAEHFIFMEYFIINEGQMWYEILDILERKAAAGVDVRLVYDDFGCLTRLPRDYPDYLASKGIKCLVFNQIKPIITARFNTRNHRKIAVIDNRVAFTGGINLADEYINAEERFGHWKDVGIMIKGRAAWSFTVMFLTMWDYLTDTITDPLDYKYEVAIPEQHSFSLVQPFSDNPLDNEPVGQNVYLNLINRSKNYVYICTPYLVIDDEMSNALIHAAKTGVDVRIITPHIPDKWYVQLLSRTYYKRLVKGGVKIYEYSPGFIHSKTFVVDDVYGLVGTINLDYRSLFLHFECGVWTYGRAIAGDLKKDFFETLEDCMAIEEDFFESYGLWKKICGMILRVFAPLM